DDGSHSMYIVAVEYESTLTDVCPRDLAFDVGADRHLVECDASTHRCRTTQARRPSWILGRWRAGPGPARLDVNHRTIDALDLAQADLALADFISTAAPSARIVGSDLSSAELRSANLRDAHITSSDLTNANLSGAELQGAHLVADQLADADLSDADLGGAGLRGYH